MMGHGDGTIASNIAVIYGCDSFCSFITLILLANEVGLLGLGDRLVIGVA
jgi:hypothetical protein